MTILSNYLECFDGGLIPYSDEGSLVFKCGYCDNTVRAEVNGEVRFYCTCYEDFKYSCPSAFYDEMRAASL